MERKLALLLCLLLAGCSGKPQPPQEENSSPVVTFSDLRCISQITGDISVQRPGYPNPDFIIDNQTTTRFDVYGTDLGINWEIEPGYYGFAFGDTNGKGFIPSDSGGGTGKDNWRGNVVLFSNDTMLDDGLELCGGVMDPTGKFAREVCLSRHMGYGDWTSIPTGAIHANGCEYIHYMNIKTWDGWTTNHSKMYKSADKGQTWELCKTIEWGGESNFGQVGFFRHSDGYIYMMGTQTGRSSGAKLARFKEQDIENKDHYEFWDGKQWISAAEENAEFVIRDSVGELSIAYLHSIEKWIVLYISEKRAEITMRWADAPHGPWSDPIKLVSMAEYPICYGSFIHPLSYNSEHLYFVMSSWRPYNTYLMRVDLKVE